MRTSILLGLAVSLTCFAAPAIAQAAPSYRAGPPPARAFVDGGQANVRAVERQLVDTQRQVTRAFRMGALSPRELRSLRAELRQTRMILNRSARAGRLGRMARVRIEARLGRTARALRVAVRDRTPPRRDRAFPRRGFRG